MAKVSLEKDKIKILLLEGLHPSSVEVLQAAGYTNIEYHKGSLPEEELLEAVKDVHFIGIRSRTNLSQEVINAAEKLVAVGCFCIGTNQVDLKRLRLSAVFLCLTHHSQTLVVLLNWFLVSTSTSASWYSREECPCTPWYLEKECRQLLRSAW